ncbi:MAG: hypothetical protein LW822_11190 [Phycisphaeraceae bacterium]|nr:hypothetical protein [Phycisphaeraceae bacterium]
MTRLRIADCALGRMKRTVSLPPTEKLRQLTMARGVVCWMLSVEPAWSKLTCPCWTLAPSGVAAAICPAAMNSPIATPMLGCTPKPPPSATHKWVGERPRDCKAAVPAAHARVVLLDFLMHPV